MTLSFPEPTTAPTVATRDSGAAGTSAAGEVMPVAFPTIAWTVTSNGCDGDSTSKFVDFAPELAVVVIPETPSVALIT